MQPEPTILTVDRDGAERALAVIAVAFASDPFNRWMLSDPAVYLGTIVKGADFFAGRAFEAGSADMTAGGEAAALWLPPGVGPDVERLVPMFEATVAPDRLPDLMAMLEQMERWHPEGPHWYLPLIGVDPIHQNRGFGNALLRRGTARCDADGLPAYLEATHPRNIALYRRHGFEPVVTIQAGSSPEIVAMLRRPRAGA